MSLERFKYYIVQMLTFIFNTIFFKIFSLLEESLLAVFLQLFHILKFLTGQLFLGYLHKLYPLNNPRENNLRVPVRGRRSGQTSHRAITYIYILIFRKQCFQNY